ncbi:hypothetical protein PR048_003083 [Dryococelus australis]|uniref:Uncharacterized protein n=1 Tax=Dryococelus australis TaxID=614101 RepID=A0ABQ9IM14_9NEOP|nr:hypothetical protein PR048_003083 [Dryococelus australis]
MQHHGRPPPCFPIDRRAKMTLRTERPLMLTGIFNIGENSINFRLVSTIDHSLDMSSNKWMNRSNFTELSTLGMFNKRRPHAVSVISVVHGELPRKLLRRIRPGLPRQCPSRRVIHVNCFRARGAAAASGRCVEMHSSVITLATPSVAHRMRKRKRRKGPRWCSGLTTCIPPGRIGTNSRRGRTRIFGKWESCRTMPLVGGSSQGFHVSTHHFYSDDAPYRSHFTFFGSQDSNPVQRNSVTYVRTTSTYMYSTRAREEMRVIAVSMERRRNERAGGNGRFPRKPADNYIRTQLKIWALRFFLDKSLYRSIAATTTTKLVSTVVVAVLLCPQRKTAYIDRSGQVLSFCAKISALVAPESRDTTGGNFHPRPKSPRGQPHLLHQCAETQGHAHIVVVHSIEQELVYAAPVDDVGTLHNRIMTGCEAIGNFLKISQRIRMSIQRRAAIQLMLISIHSETSYIYVWVSSSLAMSIDVKSLAISIGSGRAAVEVLAPSFTERAASTLRRSRNRLSRSAPDIGASV